MIYVTGDTHREWVERLNPNVFEQGVSLTKKDYVIICGDFGFWHDTEKDRLNLKWLVEDFKGTVLWVDGNHEHFDRLKELPVVEWNGGKVQFINDSVIRLMRGQVYTIEGKKFFTMGGASSADIRDGILERDDPDFLEKYHKMSSNPFCLFRINHVSWWKEELPNEEEMQEGLRNLSKVGNKVDFIITHSPSTSLLYKFNIQGLGTYSVDTLNEYLDKLHEKVEYNHWYFGHMHDNREFLNYNATCLYEEIVRIV